MAVELESQNPGATPQQLNALSQEVGRAPDSYVRFLKKHNGVVPKSNKFRVRSDRTGSLREMFGSDEALAVWKQMRSELGPDVLPIGEAEGGNLICLALRDGRVLYWDHDYWGSDGMTLVAESVEDLMGMLRAS